MDFHAPRQHVVAHDCPMSFINVYMLNVCDRYTKIPPVSRFYLTTAFLTTAACAVDIISPLTLYFNYDLVFHKGQFWRLITPYLFFGVFSIDFLFHMYFLVSVQRAPRRIVAVFYRRSSYHLVTM